MNSDSKNKFSIVERLRSFKYAINGLKILFKKEHNARIHLVISLLVVISGFVFNISNIEWLAILILIGFVISLEAINSAIETLSDFVSPHKNNMIKAVKDLSAGAVLIASIIAVICGCIIFLPKICDFFTTLVD
ncbi:diacylglycerol kinase family protein [Dysgonomonas sp. Marseille-P4361]|uniref:diacylglycerol kinase family protein n=1 Tax=Dysgonomonas sp. Marseille-P4361 TaxID=2161820 RepID=UPI000D555538|nr:diacylglycerol kinase family protein [Dysgonomonas sp. Marseille-P4361]